MAAVLPVFNTRAQNPPTRTLPGHIPPAIVRLTSLGRENASDHLKLAIGLPLRNEDELKNLLKEIYDPASPNYRHFLTPEEFTARFGPTEEDYQTVRRFAEQNGFKVTATHPNRVVLDVDASVTDIERTLHLQMRTYRHPLESRIFHAPSAEPTVNLGVPILHISGLDNYSIPHPNSKLKPATVQANATPKSGSAPGGAYRGNDFRAAYNVGPLTGVGQSVGLLQFDGYFASDITTYASQAGIPAPTLVNVAIDGGVSVPGDGASEVSLDIEMVMSMAPGLSKIIVYEAPNPSPFVDLLSRMANDNLAKQLSCSWGGGGVDPTSEQVFLQMAAQGQSFFNATGDSDAFTGSIPFPSESTNITQVGATTLTTTGPGGSYISETVWNWGLVQGEYTGSSGGISTHYAIPGYQTGISMTANLGSTTSRNVPDVALTGDNIYVVYNNGATGNFGGTSCAAPLWAGFTALMNQQAVAGGQPVVGFLNPALYQIGKSNPNYTSIFHDTTTGNNFSASSPSKFPATPGYDLCTGWGTPNGTNLMNALTTPIFAPVIVSAGSALVAEGCLPTNGVVDSGETVTINFSLKNVGAADTTNLVATMLASGGAGLPSAPQNYGVIVQGGSAVTMPFTFTALGSCGGICAVTLQLQDGDANLGTVTFTYPLGKLGAGFSENFDSAGTLPSGWTITGSTLWSISSTLRDTLPNSAFAPGASSAQLYTLVTPPITLPAGTPSQLSFRNNYNFEYSPGTGYDGGVLEIKIGAGSFTDIVTAGGSFVSGAYNLTISQRFNNPLRGRSAWSGISGTFIPTVVNLPASSAGQTIQLRWACGSDTTTASTGWYIDTVAISNIVCCSGSPANHPAVLTSVPNVVMFEKATLAFTNKASDSDLPTQTLTYSLSNAPAGASITPGTGVFTWTPTEAQGPSTNLMTVFVTDNGTPPLSSSQSFSVTVLESNEPPVLAPISNRAVHAGMTLVLTNSATDADVPANSLSFSVFPGPAGANVNVTNGVFTWTPNSSFANTTNSVTIVVTDYNPAAVNAQHLSDAKTFTVFVAPPPTFSSAAMSNGALTLTWSAISGQKYRVQYSTNLLGTNWTDLPPDVTATGTTAIQTDSTLSGTQRFYRIMVLP